ncbi:MAG: hypothetical protein B1H04_00800 [Planctomycetales bacterium 4484_123]|nr:MAG: hypothetical protein B1H04_00800 [Planctomycetales bacterium 4484_123]
MTPAGLAGTWFTLLRPWWLLALSASLLPLLAARWAGRRGRGVSRWSVTTQCVVIAAVALALAGPQTSPLGRAKLPCLLLLDASASVRGQDCPAMPAGTAVDRVYFAAGLGRVRPASGASTNAAPALRLIASRSSADLAVAIIATDGRFTDPDAWPAAARAVAATELKLLIVPMDRPVPDARIAHLAARHRDGRVQLTVTAVANAPLRRRLVLRRTGRGVPLLERTLTLLPDAPVTLRSADTLLADAAEYTAELSPADRLGENDSARVLVLPAELKLTAVGPSGPLRHLLGSLGRKVTFLGDFGELPASATSLAAYAGIVLADATGSALTADQRRALAEYVRSGGGLVLIGVGPHRKPADRQDPLNQVLPLVANPFQRRPLHLRVLLDCSGSMAQPAAGPKGPRQIKFDLAAQAVVALKEHLTAKDRLTVITFADTSRVLYRAAGPPDFAALRRLLGQVKPAGSTNVTPALAEALRRPAAPGTRPMLLVLSDLQTEAFDPAGWAAKLRQAKAHLAVVAIGKAHPGPQAPPLKTLTDLLKGASYVRRDDLAGLARVFAALVRAGRGPILHRQRSPLSIVAPLFGTGLTALPAVEAHLLTAARPGCELLVRTTGGEPVLARRQAGIGRSVSLALPIEGLNAAWVADPRAGRLLSGAVRWTLRAGNDPRFDVELTRRANRLHVTVSAREEGRGIDGLRLGLEVWTGRRRVSTTLHQAGPGLYRASVPCPPDVPAAVAVRDAQGRRLWQGSAAALAGQEFRELGADYETLRRLAELTGGRIVPARKLPEVLRAARRRQQLPLWPWLLGLALALMLAEWCLTHTTRKARQGA